MNFTPKIGLEVHVQLQTESKLFCSCSNSFGKSPNSQTCPVCLGMPGALPSPNRQAIDMAIMLALALECEIPETCKFDRKNYFYHDLPKGYQVTQYENPLGRNGKLSIYNASEARNIRINRIHIEEDAGKSIHGEFETLIDYNRAGVPLVEIVTEPDIASSQEAYSFLFEVRRLVKWLGICDGSLEEGSLRCDANISLINETNPDGVPVEIKNLNSLHGVERALNHEIQRQTRLLAQGKMIVRETRMWDEDACITSPLRSKEGEDDYRYFPDPDLLPLTISSEMINRLKNEMPEPPSERKKRFVNSLKMRQLDADVILSDRNVADYFEDVYNKCFELDITVRWITGEALRWRQEIDGGKSFPVPAKSTARLIQLEKSGQITVSSAKKIYEIMARENLTDPDALATRENLWGTLDSTKALELVIQVLNTNKDAVRRYKSGSMNIFNLFMGQILKIAEGKVSPDLVKELLLKALQSEDN